MPSHNYGFEVVGYEYPTKGDVLQVTLWDHLGHLYVIPRLLTKDFIKDFNGQMSRAKGIYILVGDTQRNGKREAYIGQVGAGEFKNRLQSHVRGKLWWTTAYVVADASQWTREMVDYMEARAIQVAQSNLKYELENRNGGAAYVGDTKVLHRADNALNGVRQMMTALGEPVLSPVTVTRKTAVSKRASAPFPRTPSMRAPRGGSAVTLTRKGANASGMYDPSTGTLTVLAGSTGAGILAPRASDHIKSSRQRVLDSKMATVKGDTLAINSDITFTTPSAAATFVMGGSANGWVEWKLSSGEALSTLRK